MAGKQTISVSEKILGIKISTSKPANIVQAKPTKPRIIRTEPKPGEVKPRLTTKPSVSSVNPQQIALYPGGKPAKITIKGKNLSGLDRVQVLLKNTPTRNVLAKVNESSDTYCVIIISADQQALPSKYYSLRIGRDKNYLNIPPEMVKIQVLPRRQSTNSETIEPDPGDTPGTSYTISQGMMQINHGSPVTGNRVVILIFDSADLTPKPTHYRVSESPEFSDVAQWKSYVDNPEYSPEFTLSDGYGQKTIYCQVKSNVADYEANTLTVLESNVISDSIELAETPPPLLSEVTVVADSFTASTIAWFEIKLARPADEECRVNITLTPESLQSSHDYCRIKRGETTGLFSLNIPSEVYWGITSNLDCVITAELNGIRKSKQFTVTPRMPLLRDMRVSARADETTIKNYITIDKSALPGGCVVKLSSNNPNVTVPSEVIVPENETKAYFPISAKEGSEGYQSWQITAKTEGIPDPFAQYPHSGAYTGMIGDSVKKVNTANILSPVPRLISAQIDKEIVQGFDHFNVIYTVDRPSTVPCQFECSWEPSSGRIFSPSSKKSSTLEIGQTSGSFPLQALDVFSTCDVNVTVTNWTLGFGDLQGPDDTQSLSLTVVPRLQLQSTIFFLIRNTTNEETLILNRPAPEGGITFTFGFSGSYHLDSQYITFPESVHIPEGQNRTTFPVIVSDIPMGFFEIESGEPINMGKYITRCTIRSEDIKITYRLEEGPVAYYDSIRCEVRPYP